MAIFHHEHTTLHYIQLCVVPSDNNIISDVYFINIPPCYHDIYIIDQYNFHPSLKIFMLKLNNIIISTNFWINSVLRILYH